MNINNFHYEEKMKKNILLALLIGFTFMSCATGTTNVREDLVIQPDPENPLQGTWINNGLVEQMHVIRGMKGVHYVSQFGSWKINTGYDITEDDHGYVTSNFWRMNIKDDILTVEDTVYERYKQE